MNFGLTSEQQDIQRLARDFAVGEVAPAAEELDRTKSFPYEIVAKLGELGLMGIPYPEDTDSVAAMQTIIADLAVKVDELLTAKQNGDD